MDVGPGGGGSAGGARLLARGLGGLGEGGGLGGWHARAPLHFAEAAGLVAPPAYIDSFGREAPDALPQGGVTNITFRNNHLQYALTWYGLALTLVGVWAAFLLKE